jgi:hypothetical protein
MMLKYVVLVVSLLSWIAAAALVHQTEDKSMRVYAGVVLSLNLMVFVWMAYDMYDEHAAKLPSFDAHYSPFDF